MELAPFVSLRPAEMVLGLARAKLTEVLGGLGDHIRKELELDATERLACTSWSAHVRDERRRRRRRGRFTSRVRGRNACPHDARASSRCPGPESRERRLTSDSDVEEDSVGMAGQQGSRDQHRRRLGWDVETHTGDFPTRAAWWEPWWCGEEQDEEVGVCVSSLCRWRGCQPFRGSGC